MNSIHIHPKLLISKRETIHHHVFKSASRRAWIWKKLNRIQKFENLTTEMKAKTYLWQFPNLVTLQMTSIHAEYFISKQHPILVNILSPS